MKSYSIFREQPQIEVVRGDCFSAAVPYLNSTDLIIADPPYGGILPVIWDKWPFYDALGRLIEDLLVEGGTAFVWGGVGKYRNRPFFKWLSEVENGTRLHIWDVITWGKRRAYGCSDRLLFTREECAMLVKGDKPKTFNIPLSTERRGYAGYNAQYPAKSEFKRITNVWTDIGELFKGKIHPAEKPAALAERMIRMSSNPGDLVLDLLAGSGSTGLAAKAVGGRRCVLIEKSDCEMRSLV